MAVPKQNRTKSQQGQRRMHIFLEESRLTVCPKCGKPVLPHTVCQNCGYYKGMEIINVLKKLTRKEKKKREKEMTTQEREEKKAKPLSMEELSKR